MGKPTKGIVFDDDLESLVYLLLRKHATENNDWQRYNNIAARLSFDIANRGLRLMGYRVEAAAPSPESKK